MLKKILAIVAMLYAAATFAAVDVNKATAAELDGIKGIGPAISTKIIDERNASLQLKARTKECDSPSVCFKELGEKQGDAYMMDDIQLFALRAQDKNPADWEVVGKLLSIEPLAIMLPKGDAVWKQHFDRVLRQMIHERSFHTAYSRWFEAPIPPRQLNYNIPMNYLLKDSLKFPSDQVGD